MKKLIRSGTTHIVSVGDGEFKHIHAYHITAKGRKMLED